MRGSHRSRTSRNKVGFLRRITKRERQPPLESETPVGDHIHQPVAQEGADRRSILEPRTELEAFVNGDELCDRHMRRNVASAMGFGRKARRAVKYMLQAFDGFPRRNAIRDTRVPRGGIQSVKAKLERPDAERTPRISPASAGLISLLSGSDKEMCAGHHAAERGSYRARRESTSRDTSGGGRIRITPSR